jgi:hypothetical protein
MQKKYLGMKCPLSVDNKTSQFFPTRQDQMNIRSIDRDPVQFTHYLFSTRGGGGRVRSAPLRGRGCLACLWPSTIVERKFSFFFFCNFSWFLSFICRGARLNVVWCKQNNVDWHSTFVSVKNNGDSFDYFSMFGQDSFTFEFCIIGPVI